MTRLATSARAAAALGLAAALGGYAVDGAAERQVGAALAAMPGVTAGAVRRDGRGDLVVDGLRIARGGLTVSVGQLAIAGAASPLWPIGRAEAQSANVVVDDITVTGGRNVYRVPHLEVAGTFLTAADIAALVDPAKPGTVEDRLARFTAAVVKAPTVVVAVSAAGGAPPPTTVTLHDVTLTGVAGGRIGSLTARRLDAVDAAAPDAPAVETGRIRIDALDAPLARRLTEGGRTDPAEALKTLFSSATVEAVTLRGRNANTATVGALRSGAVRARPLPATLDDTLALAGHQRDDLTVSERRRLADGAADLARSYELDHLEIDDLAAKDHDGTGRPVTLARLTLDALGGTKPLSMAVDGLAVDTPDVAATLAHLTLLGVDQAGAVALARRYISQDGSPHAEAAFSPTPAHAALALDALRISVPVAGGTGNAADGARNSFEVPEFSSDLGPGPGGTIASSLHVRLVYPLPAPGVDPAMAGLTDLGLSRLDVTGEASFVSDPAAGTARLDPLAVSVKDLGSVAVGVVVSHVPSQPSFDGAQRAIAATTLDRLSVGFIDAGLAAKALPRLAASANVSVPLFKAEMKSQAEVSITKAFGDTPAAAGLVRALSAFIDDPRSLRVAVTIPGGLTADALKSAGDPAALLARMKIEATANR